jgi:hypothetical protein
MDGQVGYAQFQDAVARRALGWARARERGGKLRVRTFQRREVINARRRIGMAQATP